jgi:hypothetical protein
MSIMLLALKVCSNEANIVQQDDAKNVAQCWTKISGKFKLKPTSSIINIVFKRGQHVASNTAGRRLNRPLVVEVCGCEF